MNIAEFIKSFDNLHKTIAEDVYPAGGWFHCKTCDRWEEYTTEDAAYCLAHGWPRCCGHDMTTTEHKPEAE